MKLEWPKKVLSDVAEIFDGPHATPKTVDSGPIFLGIGALQDGVIILGKTRHVTARDFRRWTQRVTPRSDDVVFAYETRLGQAAIIPKGLECCLGRRMGLVRFHEGAVVPRFFLYQYLSPPFQEFLGSRTIRGATVDRISIKDFPSFPIAVPPLLEQKRIVGVLDEALEGIATAKANAAKSLVNASALFQSYLDETLTQHREGWTRTELGNVCERIAVGHVGITSPHYREAGVLFLRTQNVGREGLQLDNVNFITEQFHASLKKSQVRPGDILMSRVITDAVHCALIPPGLGPTNCANVVIVRPGSNVVPEYLVWHIRSREAQRHLLSRKVGSAQVVVNTTVVKEWPVDVPPVAVQREIATGLDRMNAEAKRLEAIYRRKVVALEALKMSLLRQAFTGQL